MSSPSLRARTTKGAAWVLLRQVYLNLTMLLSMVVLARLLQPSQFGLVALGSTFVNILTLLSDLGMTPSLVRLKKTSELQDTTAFWLALAMGLIGAAGLSLASFPLSHAYGQPDLTKVLPALSLSMPANALALIPTATLTRSMSFRPITIRTMVATTVGVVGAIILALAGAGVWALVFQTVGGAVAGVAVLWTSVAWRPSFQFSRREARALLAFGLPAMATRSLDVIRDNGVELIIGSLLGTVPLGQYTVAARITKFATALFTQVVTTVSLPAFTAVRENRRRLEAVYRRSVRTSGGLSVPMLVGLAAISPTLIPLVFGNQWSQTATLAQIIPITSAIVVLTWVDGNIWWAIEKPKTELALAVGITLMHVAAAIIGAQFGVLGVAIALLCRAAISVPIRMLTLVRFGHFPVSVYADLPAQIVCAAIMFGAVVAVRGPTQDWNAFLATATQVAVGVVVYLAASLVIQRHHIVELVIDARSAVVRRDKTSAAA